MTSSPVTAFLLIRHAQPVAGALDVCHGTLDVPLSDEGFEQARRLADHLADAAFDAVYSSPRTRALATAAAIAVRHGLEPIIRGDLAEIDFGAFEGRPFDEIAATYPDVYARWMSDPTTVRFPDGESYDDLRRRATSEFARMRREHEGGSVAVVAHGGVIRALLADILGVSGGAIFRIDQSWAGMTSVEYAGDEPIIRSLNATA